MIEFSPKLGSHTPITLGSSPASLYFSALVPLSEDATPAIWTNIPSISAFNQQQQYQEWRSIPFTTSVSSHYKSDASQLRLWSASIVLPSSSSSSTPNSSYEFTYRLEHQDSHIQWLGDQRGNGRVTFRAPVPHLDVSGTPTSAQDNAQIRVARFKVGEGEGGEDGVKIIKLSAENLPELKEFMKREQEEGKIKGFTLEQSERPWFIPRLFTLPTSDSSDFAIETALSPLSPSFLSQLLLLHSTSSNSNLLLIPVSTKSFSATLVKDGLRCVPDSPANDGEAFCIVATGYGDVPLRQLMDRAIGAASEIWTNEEGSNSEVKGTQQLEKQPWGPHGVTWCTWNALGPDYTLYSVISSLKSFFAPSSPPSHFPLAIDTLLLDDGWQDVRTFADPGPYEPGRERRGLYSFAASSRWLETEAGNDGKRRGRSDSGFASESGVTPLSPRSRGLGLDSDEETDVKLDLKEAVRKFKEFGISTVGVWMTLGFYWDAIHPSSPLAEEFGPFVCLTLKSEALPSADTTWYLPRPEKMKDYYTAYFESPKEAGIGYVKVDDQAHEDFILTLNSSSPPPSSPIDLGTLRLAMLHAMQDASKEVFGEGEGGRTIFCMAGSPRIFGGRLAFDGGGGWGGRHVVRNSDDYWPDRPDSHRWHIMLNSYTSWYSRSINFWPDFDMCQEDHPYGPYHIAFRAFSPAPIFSTDVPGSVDLVGSHPLGWSRLLAPSVHGGIKVLKTETETGAVLEGRIGEDCMGGGDGPALKVGMRVEGAKGALIGLWNAREGEGKAVDVIDARDLADALSSGAGRPTLAGEGEGWIAYSDQDQTVHQVTRADVLASEGVQRPLAHPISHVELAKAEAKVITIASTWTLERSPSSLPATGGDGNIKGSVKIACLGLLGKYAGLCAIRDVKVDFPLPAFNTSTDHQTTPLPPASTATTPSSLARRSSADYLRRGFAQSPSRLAFLLACLVGFRRSANTPPSATSSSSSATTSTTQPRTFQTELQNLTRDFVRHPVTTVWSEVGALVGLFVTAYVWASTAVADARRRKNGGAVGDRAGSILPSPLPAASGSGEKKSSKHSVAASGTTFAPDSKVLRVDLTFAGVVGIWSSKPTQLKFNLDGEQVLDKFITIPDGGTEGLVKIDVEASLGSEKVTKGKKEGAWCLEVGL
ncbi:hypothetical protein T439DRAFT_325885 [Meredithblackwellia eburnea MCA 4105]